jgi:hypothetical protein
VEGIVKQVLVDGKVDGSEVLAGGRRGSFACS